MKSLVTVFLVCLLATQSVPPVCHGSSDDCGESDLGAQ